MEILYFDCQFVHLHQLLLNLALSPNHYFPKSNLSKNVEMKMRIFFNLRELRKPKDLRQDAVVELF